MPISFAGWAHDRRSRDEKLFGRKSLPMFSTERDTFYSASPGTSLCPVVANLTNLDRPGSWTGLTITRGSLGPHLPCHERSSAAVTWLHPRLIWWTAVHNATQFSRYLISKIESHEGIGFDNENSRIIPILPKRQSFIYVYDILRDSNS